MPTLHVRISCKVMPGPEQRWYENRACAEMCTEQHKHKTFNHQRSFWAQSRHGLGHCLGFRVIGSPTPSQPFRLAVTRYLCFFASWDPVVFPRVNKEPPCIFTLGTVPLPWAKTLASHLRVPSGFDAKGTTSLDISWPLRKVRNDGSVGPETHR